MENTGNARFPNDSAQWYVAVGDQPAGPFKAAEVYEKLSTGEMTPAHYAWKKGMKDWKRLLEFSEFQIEVPKAPPKNWKPPEEVTPPAPPPSKPARVWFLYYNDSQFGPFSRQEVERFLSVGKIHSRVYAWKDGMGDWKTIGEISDFSGAITSTAAPVIPKPQASSVQLEQRAAPRRPLVARLLMASGSSVIVGVCRDVSVGGMQVLTDDIPGPAGTRLKLNVSPTEAGTLQPFVAEGQVVRVLEDGRGFSFRFDKIDEQVKKALQEYIHASRHIV